MSRSLIVFLVVVCLFSGRTDGAPSPATSGCSGCGGAGGSSTASGGTCGGFLSIFVAVGGGRCRWYGTPDPLFLSCFQSRPCEPAVTRTWTGLDPNTPLEFCLTLGGETFCLENPVSSGSTGSGSDSRDSVNLGCGSGTTFTVSSASCGLSASAQASCMACIGN
jgi:hypothetical protein